MLSIISAGVTYLRARFSREDGAVATEYGLLLVLIALAIVVAATAIGLAGPWVLKHAIDDPDPEVRKNARWAHKMLSEEVAASR